MAEVCDLPHDRSGGARYSGDVVSNMAANVRDERSDLELPDFFRHMLGNQWLGDKRTQRVHNLDNIQPSCHLDELLASEQYASFGPDLLGGDVLARLF